MSDDEGMFAQTGEHRRFRPDARKFAIEPDAGLSLSGQFNYVSRDGPV